MSLIISNWGHKLREELMEKARTAIRLCVPRPLGKSPSQTELQKVWTVLHHTGADWTGWLFWDFWVYIMR